MKNKEELINILKRIYSARFDDCFAIYINELVNSGKMTVSNLQLLMTSFDILSEAETSTLVLLLKPLEKHKTFKLPELETFFTRNEIYNAELVWADNLKGFPVELPIYAKLTDKDNYLTCLTIQQIARMKEAGIIQWKENMQRESVIVKLSETDFVSHIKYDDKRARAIGESISENQFYPNALRWHILSGACEYEVTKNSIILKSGYIAEIDGQHRDKGSEYALRENPDIIMSMPIILTIGSPFVAQQIISQDEKRAPIDKDVVAIYKQTSGNSILNLLIGSNKIDPVYKFCDTIQGIQTGSGFVLKSTVSEAIDRYYCKSKLSRVAETQIAEWLVDFFNVLADIMFDDFSNYKKSRKQNCKTAFQVFEGYILISSVLYYNHRKDDWVQILSDILDKVDFVAAPRETLKQIKYIMKEEYNNG